MKDCIFCNIAKDNSGTEFLYNSNTIVAIQDINPAAPVHLLIIPKKHVRSINDLSSKDTSLVSEMIIVAKNLAELEKINKSGYKLLFNVEKGGGQVIFHLHLHLMGGHS